MLRNVLYPCSITSCMNLICEYVQGLRLLCILLLLIVMFVFCLCCFLLPIPTTLFRKPVWKRTLIYKLQFFFQMIMWSVDLACSLNDRPSVFVCQGIILGSEQNLQLEWSYCVFECLGICRVLMWMLCGQTFLC